jgi:hypothetical protein
MRMLATLGPASHASITSAKYVPKSSGLPRISPEPPTTMIRPPHVMANARA